MEYEGIEQEILLEPENAVVGAVYSVNGKTGDVVLTTSDLENDSDYQTGDEVDAAITTAIAGKQDTLTAGNNIQISAENVISATDTTYSAGNGLNLSSENVFSVDTIVVATQQNLATEVQNRENADNALQAQIDGISASSDVVDIVGTYADLQNYDTSKLKDNDIIKVLQDSTQNNATTYYRWSTSTDSFTLIGQEGPYYTKAAADAQFVPQTRTVNGKALGTNITLNASDVSALGTSDVVQTTGTSTSQVMSQNATTQALSTKLNITDYVVDDELKNSTNPVQNGVLYGLLGNMPTDFFSGNATATQSGTEAQFTNALKISDIELNGDTFQQTYTGKNLYNGTRAETTSSGLTYSADTGQLYLNGNRSSSARLDFGSKVIPAGTYTFMLELVSGSIATTSTGGLFYFAGTGVTTSPAQVYLSDFNKQVSMTVTIPSDTSCVTYIYARSSETFTNAVIKYQLVQGSTPDYNFEPFVGGTASPSPSYPQDIQVVTGTQTVNVHGKNLLNNTLANDTKNGVTATRNADGSVTLTGTSASGAVTWFVLAPNTFVLPAGTYTFSGGKGSGSNIALYNDSFGVVSSSVTKTLESGSTGNWNIRIGPNTPTNVTVYPMLEAGSDTSAYEPYISTDYTVALGSIELAKLGDYQDYIYKSGDDWYVHKTVRKLVVDGTVTWTKSPYGTNTYSFAPNIPPVLGEIYDGKTLVLSNSFSGVSYANRNVNMDNITFTTQHLVFVRNMPFDTVTELQTFCENNNPIFYYALATPTDTQITDSTLVGQLNALYNAKMLAGQTNFAVSAVSPNLPAILDITMFNANAQGIIANIRG